MRTILLLLMGTCGMNVSCAGNNENIVFPADSGIVDVTQPPYELKGDGETDNTRALRRAFADFRGKNRTLYFPNGTYLFSGRINISGDAPSRPHSRDRFLHIQGQSREGVVLKLAERSPGYDRPKTFLSLYEGKSTGDVMHSYVRHITVEIGAGNPGAAALRYMTNNHGSLHDVTIRSADPDKAGAIGLDLRQSQNGPGLVKRVMVDGFDHGIETANTFALHFEDITLINQRKAAFRAGNSRLTIRGLTTRGAAPAFVGSEHTQLTLLDADLQGDGSAEAAIVCESPKTFLRDIRADGYAHTVRASDGRFVDGEIDEWRELDGQALFADEPQTLRLPVRDTPRVPWETDLRKWTKVEHGTDTIQAAIDRAAAEGDTTVYFPKRDGKGRGQYVITRSVRIHGSVRRIIGMENILAVDEDKFPAGETIFTFAEDLEGVTVFERFFQIVRSEGDWHGLEDSYLFESRSPHPVVIRNLAHAVGDLKKPCPGRTWYFEDISGNYAWGAKFGKGETAWMRHYNPESWGGIGCEVDGGTLWILGMKTEGRFTHIDARNGARVELLGGVSYQSWKRQELDPPMFVVEDSEASFTFGFYHHKAPYATIVRETRHGETRTLRRAELDGYHLPVYRAGAMASDEPTKKSE